MTQPQVNQHRFVQSLRFDAKRALHGRQIYRALHARAAQVGLSGSYEAGGLFNTISDSLKMSSFMALARLHDNGTGAISIPRAASTKGIEQPSDIRLLKKELNKGFLSNLREWRNQVYAHSLDGQLSTNINASHPILHEQVDGCIEVTCRIVNAYAELNLLGSWPPVQHDPDLDSQAATLVDKLFA